MSDFNKIIGGFNVFKATTYLQQKDAIGHLIRQGLKPKTMFITCSDLRLSPGVIFSSNPGEFYVFRNVAALIPPHDVTGANGIVAAIEYGICELEVESIIVLGHAKCDGIKMLMDGTSGGITAPDEEEGETIKEHLEGEEKNLTAMKKWLEIAEDARDAVKRELSDKPENEQMEACEHESILVSLRNLISYPFVEERIRDDSLDIHGFHFNIETGELLSFNPETKFFEPVG